MMETICQRRTIRSYTGEMISEKELDVILKAANAAPVGMGRYEDSHLTIITDPALLGEIKAAAGMTDRDVLYGATIVENMALAAAELGVGACHIWGATMAMSSKAETVAKLSLPEGFVPCCAIALGKTSEKYEMRDIPCDRIGKNVIA